MSSTKKEDKKRQLKPCCAVSYTKKQIKIENPAIVPGPVGSNAPPNGRFTYTPLSRALPAAASGLRRLG
jgi:hypothetical protein